MEYKEDTITPGESGLEKMQQTKGCLNTGMV
jgi:hypothetical protein